MIRDPISLESHPTNATFAAWRKEGLKEVFFTLDFQKSGKRGASIIYLLDLLKSSEGDYFVKFAFYHSLYDFQIYWLDSIISGNSAIDKDVFIEKLQRKHPEYFLWFLFNPGWL